MDRNITIEELLKLANQNEMTMIDVRSPSEFQNATIPGSINIPFFTDQERAEVGTLYKQVSPEAAQERGLEIASAKLPAFVQSFKEIEGEKAVFCWRGGMRSKTTATVLELMKIHVFRLEGGFRSYRKWVVDRLETMDFTPQAYILDGNTGTGKTAILRGLQQEGLPVIDLEKLANHRGSIFGGIGLEPHNQKVFDSLLVQRMEQLKNSSFVLFEGESRRVGKALLPPVIEKLKDKGTHIFIKLPMEERIQTILDDYQPWEHQHECMEAFSRIKARIHTPIAEEVEQALKNEEYSLVVRRLLEYYYDPRYQYAAEQYPEAQKITIHAHNIAEAKDKVRQIVSKQRIPQKG